MKKKFSTKVLIIMALGVVFNIVLALIAKTIGGNLLFLDTIGTIFVAAFFGPIPGIITGVVTNLVNGVISGPTEIPFLLVNGAIGLIVGLIAKYRKDYNIVIALIVGLILSVVAPLIGTPIAIFMFGGLSGSGADFIILWLKSTGQNLFSSVFLGKITENLVDKIVSSLIVYLLFYFLPLSVMKDSILEKLIARKESKLSTNSTDITESSGK